MSIFQALYQEAFTESLKKAGLVYHPMCVISCSSALTGGFLTLVLLQVFSKRTGKGADGEDRSAGTTEECCCCFREKGSDAATAGTTGWLDLCQFTMFSSCLSY